MKTILLTLALVCTSPVFLLAAEPEEILLWPNGAELYLRFKKTGVKTELHIYSTGGHGFGVRESNKRPVGQWTERLVDWMKESGFIEKK